SFAYWSDIVIEKEGERTVIGGNGFAGCSRRNLLALLQKRCEDVGVRLHFRSTIPADEMQNRFADYDLIIAADGINSPVRERLPDAFGAQTELTRNKFAWMGSTRPLDAFTFFFRQTRHGPFCAHTYQYANDRSTWVIETTPECWAASGFDTMSEEES